MDNEKIKALRDSLTDEQKEKAAACKSQEELSALLGKLGVELSDELLDNVAGGVKDGPRHYNRTVQKPTEIV